MSAPLSPDQFGQEYEQEMYGPGGNFEPRTKLGMKIHKLIDNPNPGRAHKLLRKVIGT
jgi:hypothetical protein